MYLFKILIPFRMKLIILILMLLLSHSSSFGQENCKKRQLDSIEKSIIREYINQAVKNNWFEQDMGVVVVSEDFSQLPKVKWEISISIDNSIWPDSSFTYAKYYSDLILFKNKEQKAYSNSEKINDCWSKIIGDRIYIKPEKQNRSSRLTYDGWEDGKPILSSDKKERIIPDGRRSFTDDARGDIRVYVFSKQNGIEHRGRWPY